MSQDSKSVTRKDRHALQSPCGTCELFRHYKRDWTFARCQDCKSYGHQPVFYIMARLAERIHDVEKLTEMINLKVNSGLMRSLKQSVAHEAPHPCSEAVTGSLEVPPLPQSALDYILLSLSPVQA